MSGHIPETCSRERLAVEQPFGIRWPPVGAENSRDVRSMLEHRCFVLRSIRRGVIAVDLDEETGQIGVLTP